MAALLGGGWGESSQLTGAYRRARLASAPSRRAQAGLVILKPARSARRCWRFVRLHGAGLRSLHGVGSLRQFGALLLADLRHSIGPDSLVAYWAMSGRTPRRWAGYLTPWQVHILLGDLSRRCDPELSAILRDKATFADWARSHGFPTASVLARFEGGRQVAGGELPASHLFAKPTDLFCGRGAIRLRRTDHGWTDHEGRWFDEASLGSHLAALSLEHPYIVQPCLAPHPRLSAFTTDAVPTVRAVTYVDEEGRGRLLRASVRLPLPGMIVDNVTAGGMLAAVDASTGCLDGAVRWRTDGLIESASTHPGSSATIKGTPVPDWARVVELAEAAQDAASTVPFVGWDVALTDRGPVLLEANMRWAADIIIVAHGHSLADTPFLRTLMGAWSRSATPASLRARATGRGSAAAPAGGFLRGGSIPAQPAS